MTQPRFGLRDGTFSTVFGGMSARVGRPDRRLGHLAQVVMFGGGGGVFFGGLGCQVGVYGWEEERLARSVR
jgi:hypothetical protein